MNGYGSAIPLEYAKDKWDSWTGIAHNVLDVAGYVPFLGSVTSVIDGAIYAYEGDYTSAAFAFVGILGPAGKMFGRLGRVAKSTDIKVLGRLEDTKVARDWDGHDVLNIPDWTIKKNDAWVQQGIKNKQEFYTASPEKGNLWDAAANRETVYARELRQIQEAGYVKQGDSYVHPDNLK